MHLSRCFVGRLSRNGGGSANPPLRVGFSLAILMDSAFLERFFNAIAIRKSRDSINSGDETEGGLRMLKEKPVIKRLVLDETGEKDLSPYPLL